MYKYNNIKKTRINFTNELLFKEDKIKDNIINKEVKFNFKENLKIKIVDIFQLKKIFNIEKLRKKLCLAGWNSPNYITTYMAAHIISPIICFLISLDLTYGPANVGHGFKKILIIIGSIAFGLYLPEIIVKNKTQKRLTLLKKQFPDALDILLISVESGLSVDMAIKKIGEEMNDILPDTSKEFAITSAELAYLGDKIQAYRNMDFRMGLTEYRELMTTLIQSETYGTSVGVSLREMSSRSRELRKMEIEKKAGSIGTKMTIPMIFFIMPTMFAMLIGPAVIQVMGTFIKH
jgi:tight adherence protein C